jgi:hypothetical protein
MCKYAKKKLQSIKWVIGFGTFVRKSSDEDATKGSLFSMLNIIGLFVGMKVIIFGQWDCWIWWLE